MPKTTTHNIGRTVVLGMAVLKFGLNPPHHVLLEYGYCFPTSQSEAGGVTVGK